MNGINPINPGSGTATMLTGPSTNSIAVGTIGKPLWSNSSDVERISIDNESSDARSCERSSPTLNSVINFGGPNNVAVSRKWIASVTVRILPSDEISCSCRNGVLPANT